MAKENENIEQIEAPKAKGGDTKTLNPKVFMIGIPLFILQLVIVYFVTANILLTKYDTTPKNPDGTAVEETADDEDDEIPIELGKHIFQIEDIIVNPSGTGGQRLLLVSLGFDLGNEERLVDFQTKDFIIKDVVISTLSAKSLNQLSAVGEKDSLKVEIKNNLGEVLPNQKIQNIYFSKYVIN